MCLKWLGLSCFIKVPTQKKSHNIETINFDICLQIYDVTKQQLQLFVKRLSSQPPLPLATPDSTSEEAEFPTEDMADIQTAFMQAYSEYVHGREDIIDLVMLIKFKVFTVSI